jgi:hypothetical protein
MDKEKKMEQYTSGAIRENKEDKPMFECISPIVMKRLAQVFTKGAKKHGKRNWEKGLPLSSFFASMKRHLNSVELGLMDEDHAAQALWNLHGYIHTKVLINNDILPKELDDMPKYIKKEEKK